MSEAKRRLAVGTSHIPPSISCAQCPKLESCEMTEVTDNPAKHYCPEKQEFVWKPSKTTCRQGPREVNL